MMKKLWFLATLLLGLLLCSHSRGDEEKKIAQDPRYYLLKDLSGFNPFGCCEKEPEPYRVDSYIRAAATIQEMGKDGGMYHLLSLSHAPQRRDAVFILARMLFVPKQTSTFRRPRLGDSGSLTGGDPHFWPLHPIELVDGIPFMIRGGYILEGIPETPEQYVKYCIKNCDWNTYQFKPKSAQEKKQALQKLLASPKWNRELRHYEKTLLADQIK